MGLICLVRVTGFSDIGYQIRRRAGLATHLDPDQEVGKWVGFLPLSDERPPHLQ
jgi:hypothetical protein